MGTLSTIFRVVRNAFKNIFSSKHTVVMGSTIVLLMLWGNQGKVELLRLVLPGWNPDSCFSPPRRQFIHGLRWDQEWLSFAIGGVLLVGVPALIIRLVMMERLRDYGLGLWKPGMGRLTFASTVALGLIGFPSLYLASKSCTMRDTYPLFRGGFESMSQFLVYECGYLLFFVVIEFTFRGYLLFGLYSTHHEGSAGKARESKDPPLLLHYSVVVSMLSYTAWHLGKPLPELWGTLLWGVLTGAVAITTGTILPIIAVHWAMNVFMDYLIWTSSTWKPC